MQILALILGILLLPKTCPLECYECIPGPSGSCNETTKECPSNTQCGSVRMISNMGGSEFKFMGRTCVTPDQCFSGSVNFGFAQVVINSKCCTSHLCNSQDVPDWSIPSPNGKKCSQCDGNDCTKTLTCNRNEDYCISAAVNAGGETTKVKGCASKMICSNTQTAQLSGIIGGEVSCCQGDLCNSDTTTASQPSSTTAGTTTGSQPSSTTAGTTTASKPSSTTAGTTTGSQPSSTTAGTTTGSQPSSTTAGTTTASKPSSTTAGTTTGSQPSSTTAGTTTASQPSSTTAGTTTGSQPSSTTAGKSTSTILVCFVAPLIALVLFS
ncbi:mucin-13-like [Astatotilapia calliptera]|nr:mucin-13-like [Astatotilapia calliptera]